MKYTVIVHNPMKPLTMKQFVTKVGAEEFASKKGKMKGFPNAVAMTTEVAKANYPSLFK